jgi:hypothetical protein
MYKKGLGVSKNNNTAEYYFNKALYNNNKKALYKKGIRLKRKKEYKSSKDYLLVAARAGHIRAKRSLGKLYIDNLNEYKLGIKWLKYASNENDYFSKYFLYEIHKNNNEYKKALSLAKELVCLPDSDEEDFYNLAKIYYETDQYIDYKKAFYNFNVAANRGHIDSAFYLYEMYKDGKGVPQNYTLAYMWATIYIAYSEDDEDYEKRRSEIDFLEVNLTNKQISEAQNKAKQKWSVLKEYT